MLSDDKAYDGDQAAQEAGAEDAGGRRADQAGSPAERATCSPLTVARIEKGTPTVAIGIYLRVLYALQLDDDILLLAREDKLGKALQDLNLKTRERASKKR